MTICRDPLLGGIARATDWNEIRAIVDRYRAMYSVFLLLVDRDANEHRAVQLRTLEEKVRTILPAGKTLIAEHAWEELEVWLLAGHDLPREFVWNDVRGDRDPKERYYVPFAKLRGVFNRPAQGRQTLGDEAARRMDRVCSLCPEVADLERRIRAFVTADA